MVIKIFNNTYFYFSVTKQELLYQYWISKEHFSQEWMVEAKTKLIKRCMHIQEKFWFYRLLLEGKHPDYWGAEGAYGGCFTKEYALSKLYLVVYGEG